ncbi:MAG: hypothetical protein Harvfovirus54_1, partial [Harvfovirus sp.]
SNQSVRVRYQIMSLINVGGFILTEYIMKMLDKYSAICIEMEAIGEGRNI